MTERVTTRGAILKLVQQEYLDNMWNPVTTWDIDISIHPASLKQNKDGLISIPIPRYGDLIQNFILDISSSNTEIINAWIVTRPNYGQGPESLVRQTPLTIARTQGTGIISLTSTWEHNLVNPDMLELVIQLSPGIQLPSSLKLTGCFIFLGTDQRRFLFGI